MNLFTLVAKIVLDATGYEEGVKKSKKSGKELAEEFRTNYTSGVESFAKGVVKAGAIAGTALGALGGIGLKYNSDMQTYTTNFRVMLGSQEDAVAKVEELRTMAAKTPFGMSDLADATQTLLSFQVPASETTGILKQLGDISLGNAQKLSGLSLVFGQVSSAGKLSGQDLMQFINQGFNPLNYIAQRTGESMEDLRARMSDGKVSVDEVKQAFVDATSEGGQFYNGMEEGSKTTSGMISTLKDDVSMKLGELFQGVSDKLAELLPKIIEFVEGIDVQQVIDTVKDAVDLFIEWSPLIIGVTTALGSLYVAFKAMEIIKSVKDGVLLLNAAMAANPIVFVIALIAALVAAFIVAYNTNEDFRNGVNKFFKEAGEAVSAFVGAVVNFFTVTVPGAFNAVIDFVKSNWQALLLFLVNPIAGALELLYNLNPKFREWVDGIYNCIRDGIGRAIDWITSLPGQAVQWGYDFIDGMKRGVEDAIEGFVNSVKGLASRISQYLHFSRPDKGPLADYETWMPDFVTGMAKGIDNNAYKLEDAVSSMTDGMRVKQGSVSGTFLEQLMAVINIPIVVDGQTIARAASPYMGTQLALSR